MVLATTGRPSYHPATLIKLYIYLNRVQSSRRRSGRRGRDIELMWLIGRLAPDHKTVANFRREHGPAIQAACAQFIVLCRELSLFSMRDRGHRRQQVKIVNTRDKNFTATKIEKRLKAGGGAHLSTLRPARRSRGWLEL